jgi:cyclophilin family peptidyl-prolyl cis-trans isomerase
MDIEVDGLDVGRLDFELFGKESPKTVNNFLGFCSGDFNPHMTYAGTEFSRIYE